MKNFDVKPARVDAYGMRTGETLVKRDSARLWVGFLGLSAAVATCGWLGFELMKLGPECMERAYAMYGTFCK